MKKRIVKIEITMAVLALIALGVYFIPSFVQKGEVMKAGKIKADGSVFTQKVLEGFSADKNAKATEIAQAVAEELNKVSQNPYDKNAPAYTFEKTCKACSSIETDDALEMVILTTYDKKGELIARTVIKPPSFVTYSSRDN